MRVLTGVNMRRLNSGCLNFADLSFGLVLNVFLRNFFRNRRKGKGLQVAAKPGGAILRVLQQGPRIDAERFAIDENNMASDFKIRECQADS